MWRIVIQDSQSFRYLSTRGAWDYDPAGARTFPRIADAALHCHAEGWKGVHIVMGVLRNDGKFDASFRSIVQVPRLRGRRATRVARSER